MIIALGLAGYAALAGVFGPRVLRARGWAARSPRLAVAAWQAVSFSVALALVLAGIELAVPASSIAGGMAGLLRSCAMAIHDAYATTGGAAAVGTGLVLALGVSTRVAWCTVAAMAQAVRQRRSHRHVLRIVGRSDAALGATIIDCATPAAYCLPGRAHRIVVSTGALEALSKPELAAVLAHEQAHLAGRHHLVVAGVDALRRAFPRVPLFAAASQEVGTLVEMLADDVAGRRQARSDVASALLRLARMTAPAASLAGSGSDTARRMRRMLAPDQPLSRLSRATVTMAIMLVVAAPIAVAAAPAIGVVGMRHCQTPAQPGG